MALSHASPAPGDSAPLQGNGLPLSAADVPAPIICPVCGTANAHDAVFCKNEVCHKALGEFRYGIEELNASEKWYERIASRVATFIGQPHFLAAHTLWFLVWIALNAGVLTVVGSFDEYPYSLLGIILSIEAIFITGFLLISDNREDQRANKLAELDYEVNVRTYRELKEIDRTLHRILERLDRLESSRRDTS